MRFSDEDLQHITVSCRDMAQCLEAVLQQDGLDEADRNALSQQCELLKNYAEGLQPAGGASLVELESEDRFEHPRRTREAFQTMSRDMRACRMLPMRKMLAQGAVSLAAVLAAGDAEALEDLLTRLGFLTFNA